MCIKYSSLDFFIKIDLRKVKMKNMLYWMFDCLFLGKLDCAIDVNVNVKIWTVFLLEATGKLAQESIV